MTKEDLIKEYYGEELFANRQRSGFIDSEGWTSFYKGWNETFMDGFEIRSNHKDEKDMLVRPLGLGEAIEALKNNNGWIKINSKKDVPEKEGQYFTFSKVSWHPYYRIDLFTGRLENSFEGDKSCFLFYQPIKFPKHPSL